MLKSKNFVVSYYGDSVGKDPSKQMSTHERESNNYLATRIAALLSCSYIGEYEPDMLTGNDRLYFVPSETLVADEAEKLRIEGPHQIFGGCVPFPFVAGKCITHPLIDNAVASPRGWCTGFGESVRHVTLKGFSAFSQADALAAVTALLPHEKVRIKAPLARGGNGQIVADSIRDAEAFLLNIDAHDLAAHGVVLETNLNDEMTRSIGTATLGKIQISYCGSQFTTRNVRGESVYGGSTLRAVRGSFNDLLDLDWSKEEVIAIAQAMIYDFAADRHFTGFYASRRNYDVAQGYDRDNQFCSGVLEQSWRIGGASPAEIAAIETFANQPELLSVTATCREVHSLCDAPRDATVYFRGNGDAAGHITKFVQIDAKEFRTKRR